LFPFGQLHNLSSPHPVVCIQIPAKVKKNLFPTIVFNGKQVFMARIIPEIKEHPTETKILKGTEGH
jgi:hypothetical protein